MLKTEDKLKIEMLHTMAPSQLASFQMLYQPLIGKDAACLYEVLSSMAVMNAKIKNHRILPELTGLSIERIEKSRHVLEQYLLMKTYYQGMSNTYIYQLFAPKEGDDFLRHEVFGRLYMSKMGKQVYEFNKLTFSRSSLNKEQYEEITIPIENVLKENWEERQEEQFLKLRPDSTSISGDMPLHFNFDRFLQETSAIVFPAGERNEKNLRLIGELATIYGIGIQEMKKLVGQSMDLKTNRLNHDKLKAKARSSRTEYEGSMQTPYLLPPVRFLQQKQQGIEVTKSDKQLVETLIYQYKMKPDVVNVLLEYVLRKTDQRLSKAYVEKIAGVWIRLQLDTYEKALQYIEKEEQKAGGYVSKNKKLPDWVIEDEKPSAKEEVFDEEEYRKELEKMRKS